MKRARGSGGRFLNTKQLQQQQQSHTASTRSTTNGTSTSGSTHLRLDGAAGDRSMPAPKTMASQDSSKKDVSSALAFTVTPIMLRRDDAFLQHPSHHLSFSGHFGQASAQAGMHNGSQNRVPVMR